MSISNYYKVEKDDPDWQFSPGSFFDRKFRMVESKCIELGEGGKDSIVLRQSPISVEMLANHLHVEAKDDSNLTLSVVNDSDEDIQHLYIYDIHVRENATLDLAIFARGGKLNKHIIQAIIEDGGSLIVTGLAENIVGGDTEIISKVAHHGSSLSDQRVYTMAGNNSQTVFQGMALLDDGCNGSKAVIQNSNLTLDPTGKCFGKPETFVDSAEVSVACQTTTDCLDGEAAQYLTCRGFSDKESMRMLVEAFTDQIFDAITDRQLRNEIETIYQY